MKRLLQTVAVASVALVFGIETPKAYIGDCSVDAMLVFDGSASMSEISLETGPNTRIFEARQAIRRAMPDIAPYRRVGLMVYGPGPKGACQNVDLRFGPMTDSAGPVIDAIDVLKPDGLTPLTESVFQAAKALDYRDSPGVIVLVTDGNETCGGRPCQMVEGLNTTARDLTIHVIGFRAEVDFFAWNNPEQDPQNPTLVTRCLSDVTGGLFVSTQTVSELVVALQRTLGCPVIG